MTYSNAKKPASKSAGLIVLLLTFTLSACSSTAPRRDLSSIEPPSLAQLINHLRAERGLGQLDLDKSLEAAALQQANFLTEQQKLTHQGPAQASTPMLRVIAAGGNFDLVAEIMGCTSNDPNEALKAWEESPRHLSRILHPEMKKIGFARRPVAVNLGCDVVWVVVFGG